MVSRATILLIAAVVLTAVGADTCTLWGVAGTGASGGTIISKNRDRKPDHRQELKLRRSTGGYAYFGLYAIGGAEPGIKAAVNEKGLAVITASAESLPRNLRDNQPGKRGVITTLMSHYAACDEVLANRDRIFPHARAGFVMISDRQKILMVEIGLNGQYALRTVENDAVVHTNHYLDKTLAEYSLKAKTSSTKRLDRIADLLENSPKPFSTESFATMSRNRHDGPNNSLWRTGNSSRTLASWIVETPPHGDVKLRVVIADTGLPERTHHFVLDETFWSEAK